MIIDFQMRKATPSDNAYVAECFINIVTMIKSQASDIYIDGLPNAVDASTLTLADSYIHDETAIVWIAEQEQHPIACIVARIENTSFIPSGIGRVGNIAMCWVDPSYREQNIAKQLLHRVENWFFERDIDVVELSYLAQNSLAEMAWSHLGYVPFRVFSHKVLKKENR